MKQREVLPKKELVDVIEEKQNVSYLIYYNFIVKEEIFYLMC